MQALIRFLQWAVKHHPWKIIALHGLFIIAVVIAAVSRLRIDTTVDGLMSTDDPDLLATRALKTEFRNDEVLFAAFDLGRPFTRDDLQRLARITDQVGAIGSVTQAISLTNVEDIRPDGAGGLDVSPLLDRDALATLDDAALQALHRRVATHPLYASNLVSSDLDVLGLVVDFELPDEGKHNIAKATREIVALVEREAEGWVPYHLAGYPVLEIEADALVKQDLLTLTPITFLAMLFVFYLIARRVFAVILLVTVTTWTGAVAIFYFAVVDTPINMVTSAVPPVLLTTAAIYGIFLIGLLQTIRDSEEPAMMVIEVVTRPAFLAMASTVAGFLSLCFIDIDAIREMGLGLAIGTVGSFIATLSLLPALVQLVDFRAPPVRFRWMERASVVGVTLARHPWRVIGGVAALVAVCIPGLSQVYIDTNVLDYFRDDSEVVRSHTFLRENLGGAGLLTVLVRTDAAGGALRPEVGRLVADLDAEAKSTPLVEHSLSLLDYFQLMDAALRPEAPPQRVLASASIASQYLLLYEMGGDAGGLAPYLNHDRSALTLSLRIQRFSSTRVLDLERRLLAVAAAHPEAHATVKVLGSGFMLGRSVHAISSGLIPGFISSLLVVLITFWITLRSFKLALIAVPPNVIPYVFCMAVFGYADIPISVGTSIVGFIAIGLAVDDTAHILSHAQSGHPLRRVYSEVGMPVVLSALALGAGFVLLGFSNFKMIAVFGLATGITLGSAVLGDIILLPSILRLLGHRLEEEPEPVATFDAAPIIERAEVES